MAREVFLSGSRLVKVVWIYISIYSVLIHTSLIFMARKYTVQL